MLDEEEYADFWKQSSASDEQSASSGLSAAAKAAKSSEKAPNGGTTSFSEKGGKSKAGAGDAEEKEGDTNAAHETADGDENGEAAHE